MTAQTVSKLSAYMLPADPQKILLPAEVVVDVTSVSTMIPVSKKPSWFLGKLGWQGRTLPLVAFNRLNSEDARLGQIRYAAVIRTRNVSEELPLFAIALSSPGRELEISRVDLKPKLGMKTEASMSVADFGGDTLYIPDIDYIESRVAEEQT